MKNLLIKKLHILIKGLGLEPFKGDIYSGYGVVSSKDMTIEQLKELITALEKRAGGASRTNESDERKSLISKCLVVITGARWMGYPNGAWSEINALVMSKHIGFGKMLNQMSEGELKECYKRLIAAHGKGFRYKSREAILPTVTKPRYETVVIKTNNIVS